jgi:2-polyprenyl-6-methoxyphenol hydroxylase-like FAD-dependent oxidoreductase
MAKVVIIGGGIGGLATAGCLRLRGMEADVYERAPHVRELGAALGLWPNATRVLKHLGVLDELIQHAHVAPAGALRDWRGRELVKMQELASDVPTVFAHRADLHRALATAIAPERLHLNKTCTGVQRQEKQVRAVFADGTFSEWVDALIGADGIRSVLREMTLRDGAPTYRGYVAWRGVTAMETTLPEDQIVGETWGRGQRFGFIPLGLGRVGWWATANKPRAEGTRVCGQSPAEWKKELLQRFRLWHTPIPQVLAATPEAAFLCNAIMDRVPPHPPKPWGDGPITLLGDAAHPTTPNLGQGACMAIEDAAVVAQALAAIPDVATAFRVYEMTRFERTARMVRASLKLGALGQWENGLACAVRNLVMRMSPERGLRKRIRDLWFYDAWNTPLVMQG